MRKSMILALAALMLSAGVAFGNSAYDAAKQNHYAHGGMTEGMLLVQTRDERKYGFIDEKGDVVIKPQFDRARNFSNGLALVGILDSTSMKYGYVNKRGKMVIPAKFADASDFSEGLASALIGDPIKDMYGYIDKTGEFVIKPQFDRADTFSEGLATVYLYSNNPKTPSDDTLSFRFDMKREFTVSKCGYIDRTGKFVIEPRFWSGTPFSEGYAAVSNGPEKIGKWGYVDKTGKFLYEPQFDFGGSFQDGLARVTMNNSTHLKSFFVDKTGIVPTVPDFNIIKDPEAEELKPEYVGDPVTGKYGYKDKTGNFVIKPQFDKAEPFTEGLAAVCTYESNPYGSDGHTYHKLEILDKDGKPIGKSYTSCKCGYIDKTGKFVIEPKFWEAKPFNNGLAAVSNGRDGEGKWGFIDRTGKFVIQPQFSCAEGFDYYGFSAVGFTNSFNCYDASVDQLGRVQKNQIDR